MCVCVKIDNEVIQVEGEIYWEVDTIMFWFYWTIIRTMRGDIKNKRDIACMAKNNSILYPREAEECISQNIA